MKKAVKILEELSLEAQGTIDHSLAELKAWGAGKDAYLLSAVVRELAEAEAQLKLTNKLLELLKKKTK